MPETFLTFHDGLSAWWEAGADLNPAASVHVKLQLMQDLTSNDCGRDKCKDLFQARNPEELLVMLTEAVTDGYIQFADPKEVAKSAHASHAAEDMSSLALHAADAEMTK